MLNWSMSLRTQTDFISPEGPNFQRAPWINIDVDGSHIKFKAPRNNTSAPVEVVHPDRSYDLNKIHSKLFGEGDYQWRSTTLITRHWNFNGPWLTGKCGAIRMSAWIMSPFNITEGLNFFALALSKMVSPII